MTSSLDYLDLNRSELFNHIRDCIAETPYLNETQNLLEVIDDLLLFWNAKDSEINVTNWRQLKSPATYSKFQSLIPTTPQNFHIDKIVASIDGSCVALSGPSGVSILELPRRWGPSGLFMEGKNRITCQTTVLSESFFLSNSHLEVQQIRWHPSSSKCHLLVLLSDNTIRVYEDSEIKHIWRVGPVLTENQLQLLNSSLPTLSNLGEQIIDFDVIPIHVTQKKNNNNNNIKYQWQVILLQGNGNIFLLNASLDSMKPKLLGPLSMTPQNFSNYGLESCSIMVMASDPPAIVVAETTGKLHHMLLLESDSVEESFKEIDSSFVLSPSAWKLKVLETVELELGIADSKDALSCPIHLRSDYINGHRYYVYHNTGLHAITMNFVGELQNYVEGKASQVFFSKPSQAEYIVCTKVDNSKKINPVLGLGLHQHPPGLISLLGSGQVVSLRIIVDTNLLTMLDKPSDDTKENTNMQSMMKDQFTTHIQNILQRKVTQPILSLDSSSTIRPQKAYEILTQSINVLNEHYIQKQSQVVREILKRIEFQNKVKEQQLSEIRSLEAEREIISQKAHLIAEKFDECSEKQTLLTKKCQSLLGMGNVSLPNNIIAEKEFSNNVTNIQRTTKEYTKAIERLKENMNKQNYHISKYTTSTAAKKVELPEKQQKALQEILETITKEMDSQIQTLKKIKKVVN